MSISNDLRERVVNFYHSSPAGYQTLAKRFGVSVISVRRWVKRKRETGTVQPLKSPGRPRIISTERFGELRSFVSKCSDRTLSEMCSEWQIRCGTPISVSAMAETLSKAGLSYKKNILRVGKEK
jgi:transposase